MVAGSLKGCGRRHQTAPTVARSSRPPPPARLSTNRCAPSSNTIESATRVGNSERSSSSTATSRDVSAPITAHACGSSKEDRIMTFISATPLLQALTFDPSDSRILIETCTKAVWAPCKYRTPEKCATPERERVTERSCLYRRYY